MLNKARSEKQHIPHRRLRRNNRRVSFGLEDMAESRALFARNLRFWLSERKFSQGELARRVGVVPSRVSQWVSGNGSPDLVKLGRIADVLSIPIAQLFAEGPTTAPEALTIAPAVPQRTIRLTAVQSESVRAALDAGEVVHIVIRPPTASE